MKNSQYRNRNHIGRKPALSSIGVAVVATLIASGAHAADTSFVFDGITAVANGHQTQNLLLNNSGLINATLQNGQGNIGANGAQTANSTFLTGNAMGASAVGNLAEPVDTSIDLSLISDTAGGNTGLASLLYSTNTGVVSSLVDDNGLSIVLTGFESGSAVNKDNTISASTVVNQGTSSIAGAVPVGYTSVTPGSTSVSSTFGPMESTSAGSIVVTTAQQTSGVTSSASAADNAVALTLSADLLADALEAGAAVTGNKIVASMKGNSSANTIDIQAVEGAPTFTGSAVVSNTQLGTNASAAANNINGSVQATVTGFEGTSALGGSLAVSGNSISSAAMGNEALGSGTSPVGNRILLADGLSFAGPSGSIVPSGATLNGYADGTAVNADLVISNLQTNTSLLGSDVDAVTSNGVVAAAVETLVNGAVALSTNSIGSSATGNAARSALSSGANAASFSGSTALANQQDNTNVSVTASNLGSSIEATAGAVQNSSVAVADNKSSASARGNEVGQSLSLNATTLALGETVSLSSLDELLEATGAATVSNRQVNTGAPVTSLNAGSLIGQSAVAVTGTTLSVTGNIQDAVALSNNASNKLTLTGTTVGSGAGILNQQRVDPEDDLPNSAVSASLVGARAFIEGGGVSGSTLAVTDNLQEAIGYGNLGNNAMVVSGTTVAAPGTLGVASTVSIDNNAVKALDGQVVAAYGLLNDQSVLSDVSSHATSNDASAHIAVSGSLDNSTALNDANTLSTEAYGNYGQSGLSLNATNVTSGDFSSVANLTSLQAVDAAITAQSVTGAVALTTVNGNVGSVDTASSVSASGNRIDAQATGSRVNNTMGVSATNIATAAEGPLGTTTDGELTTTASFSLQNVQTGQGSVTATLRDADNASLASDVRVGIVGDVMRSSVVADGNTARAAATSNNASNALAINASGQLASSSAQQNVQMTTAGVNALVGQAGLAASAGGPFDFVITGSGLGHQDLGDGAGQLTAGTLTVDTTALSAAERAYLLGDGWTSAGADSVEKSAVGYAMSGQEYLDFMNGGTLPGSGVASPIDGTPHLGGVNMAVGGMVTESALSVSGNTTYGLARGNVASNRTEVKGNAIASGSSSTVASAGASFTGEGLETVADHSLANLQQAAGAAIESNVYGSFFIDAQPGAAISGSSLSVSGNTQMAEARANTGTSSLVLDGTGVTAVSALQSAQMSSSAVSAASSLNLFAPGAVTDTSVLLSNNSNIALAVMNDATNTVTVKGSQVGTGQAADISVGGTFDDTLTAEHVLANQQAASSAVTSTATTTLNNQEAMVSETGSAVRSTLSILGNTTAAEATANQALNSASVTGTASQAASVALRNMQDSSANVTASATSAARVSLAPLASSALNNSSVALDGNSTTALARGNSASNVLNSLAGANYGPATGGLVNAGDALTGFAVNANAGILNSQHNTGAVSASSTAVSYQVALNAGGSTASNMAVTGNQVAAQAYGNSAVNQLTLNALNTGTPTSAVANYQRNSGAITATVTSVNFGAGISGAMSGSTVNVSGNQISASAVGNSVASSIMAAPR
ncbi:beta strand repeat-containing protein [Hydrogenophaga sp. BPS33]|uniref:beta strand repeat-containing protein n=1 Tax=Hydrogenophaga sp. BPS33 TaxID=2651974 RepID=UPI00131F9071|nr:S-layer family protein [Hydrogenophaga sp. BPS33]QHE87196.1 S-layer family protein [Hydrogenophaga sp. BPS33]